MVANYFKFLLIGLVFFVTACEKKEQEKAITFGFNPSENVDVVNVNGQAFSNFYKEKTGYKVKNFIATDYTALIEALRSGRIDFAWLPSFSFVKAEQKANAEILMKAVRKGRAVYFCAIITHADSGIKKIEDLRGKNIAWVDPSSTSGYIFPKAHLISKYKIDPDKFFAKQVFAGGHDSAVLAVLNRTVHATATFANDPEGKTGAWHTFLKTPDKKKQIRVLDVTKPIPGDTMATSKKFRQENPQVVADMVHILGNMSKSPRGRKILKKLYRIDSMIPATSEDYEPVREAARALNVL